MQMKRLYEAAESLRGITGQSEVARLLNASPQTVNNWEARGMSKAGMLRAQATIGCSATWLEFGAGAMALDPAAERHHAHHDDGGTAATARSIDAGTSMAASLVLTCETAAELRLLTVYRLASDDGRGAIDGVVEQIRRRLDDQGLWHQGQSGNGR